jgi:lipoic acid synthetase
MTAAPEGRKLLRLEIRNAETPIERKPEWIKTKAKMGPEYTALHSLVKTEDLHTVCQEAGLVGVVRVGLARVDLTEIAAPCALRSSDQEGRLAVFPALEDIGTPRLLAHRVQVFGLHQ